MSGSSRPQPATPSQGVLDLGIEIQRDVNGIEMGVLDDGTSFLTQRGLSQLAGAPRSTVYDITQEWEAKYDDAVLRKDRHSFFREYLARHGYFEKKLYIEIKKDGSTVFAYPDVVCMAFLEYFAFEAKSPSKEAVDNFRKLAAFGLQKFIYDALQYVPPDKWRHYHDRVSLVKSSAPDGYWLVFNEIGGMITDLIAASLTVNDKTIPDISVGKTWATHWEDSALSGAYGERVRCAHDYPSYFAQAASNPQVVWAYPDAALPEFRRWFRHEYLPTRFPRYILSKAHLLPGGKPEAVAIGNMYQPKQIGP